MYDDRSDFHVGSRPLSHGWTVREITTERSSPTASLPVLPAQVPGHVHLDLIRAGVIQDPFHRLAERGSIWVDHTDWAYETTFDLDEAPRFPTYLSFGGLDTIAEIELNGEPIGATDNMFIPHEILVTEHLVKGPNRLQIIFRSPIRTGWERQNEWDAGGNDSLPFDWQVWNARSFIRKAQYMYGWDWGPEPASCGIWGPVELATVPIARILDWRYDVEFKSDGGALLHIEAFIERMPTHGETP